MRYYLLKAFTIILRYMYILYISIHFYIFLYIPANKHFFPIQCVKLNFFSSTNICLYSIARSLQCIKIKHECKKLRLCLFFWSPRAMISANNNILIIYLMIMSAIGSYRHRQVSIILSNVFRRTRRTS